MKTILILLAHNDDEYFITQKIQAESQAGNRLLFMYTTYGSLHGADSQARIEESIRLLSKFKIPKENIISIGFEVGNFDGDSHRNMGKIYDHILLKLQDEKLDEIVTMAWEGGNHDHDAVHLIGKALAMKYHLEKNFFEFPAYNGYKLPGHFFNVGRFIPSENPPINKKLSFKEIAYFLPLFLEYKSQKLTFFYLFPMIFYRTVVKRVQPLRLVPQYDYQQRPHGGKLYYERHFKMPFEEFKQGVQAWLQQIFS
jgi:hypothetical protein